ncbi:hypothetical protein FB451DRAFT_1185414 [Mycena latifolia]|nr:hypothetical protein FB451DRAFT_1185414 [Mycena latifolia]
MARDEHAEKMELIPDLQPLRNGDSVVGPNGSYYMGGVNNGQGLDAEQSDQLNRMIDGDEPRGEEDMDEDVELFAWFSDEVFTGGSDIDECSGVLQPKTAAEVTWHQPASCRRSLKKRDSPGCMKRAAEAPAYGNKRDNLKDVRLLEEEIERREPLYYFGTFCSYRQPHGIVHQASLQKQVKDSFPAMYNRSREEWAAQLEAAREHKKRRERKKAAKEREEREAKERAERAQQRAVALAKKAAAAMAARMRAVAVTLSTPRMLPGTPTRPCPGHVEQAALAALVWLLKARGLAGQKTCWYGEIPRKTVAGASTVGEVRPCAQDLRGSAGRGIRHPYPEADQTQGTPILAAAKSLRDDGTAVWLDRNEHRSSKKGRRRTLSDSALDKGWNYSRRALV